MKKWKFNLIWYIKCLKDIVIIYIMLFYNKYGKLVQINRMDFINDKLYFEEIQKIKLNKLLTNTEESNEYPIENMLIKKIFN